MNQTTNIRRQWQQTLLKMGVIPFVFYFVFFCIFTYPLITHFTTNCFCNRGDGYQYVWDLWWVNKAVTQLHRTPWQTSYLFYPHGLSLLVHDLNSFNGFVGIGLLKVMPLPQVYNAILLIGFTLTGMAMFWLAYEFTGSYPASLLAGFILNFSNDHFAHATLSHLTLISLYWLPLFVLYWYRLMDRPTIRRGIIVALILLGGALTSVYFLYICVLAGAAITLWFLILRRDIFLLFRSNYRNPLAAFLIVTLLTTGIFSLSLVLLNRADPIIVNPFGNDNVSGHSAADYSTDILGMFTPGGRLGSALLSYLSKTNIDYRAGEHNAYAGALALTMLLFVLISWRKWEGLSVGLWYWLWLLAVILALGPVLHIAGITFPSVPMPYNLLVSAIPLFSGSGVPARMTALALLAVAMISAFGFKFMFANFEERRWLVPVVFVIILAIFMIDYWPLPIPDHQPVTPEYVQVIKGLPDGAVIDDVTDIAVTLYYQTTHEKPIVFAYTSRSTMSVGKLTKELRGLLDRQEYEAICPGYNIRYLVVTPDKNVLMKVSTAHEVYRNDKLAIYDLACTSDF